MGLEDNLEQTDYNSKNLAQIINISAAAVSTTIGYNVAGAVTTATDYSSKTETFIAAGILSASAIVGYKAIPTIYKYGSKIKNFFVNIKKRIKRNTARNRTLREIAKDKEFQEAHGINLENFSKTKSALRTILLSPVGGALGYYPGAVGIMPLCVYFGEKAFDIHYSSSGYNPALDSGPIAGLMIGAYAFAEMSLKKQYEKMATSASALAGITGGFFLAPHIGFRRLSDDLSLWTYLGVCATAGAITGFIGNKIYSIITNKVNSNQKLKKIINKKL